MRKLTALFLALILTMGLSVMPASAEGVAGTSGTMTVSYSVQSAYLINLPDITLTDENNTFDITADYVNIERDKVLQVVIDCTQTLTDGKFILYSNRGAANEATMECLVYISNCNSASQTTPSYLSGKTTKLLANFRPGDTIPEDLGRMTLTPVVSSTTSVGNYTGKIYYIIKVV